MRPALPLIPLIPGLCLVPMGLILFGDVHGGGLPLLCSFAAAALHPSLEPSVLVGVAMGIRITLVVTLVSWGISSVLGCLLGVLGSKKIWRLWAGITWPALMLRKGLAPLRAIHELIWGLLLLQILGLNGWVAVIAIVIPYTVLLARVIADQIDCQEPPALPALQSSGASAVSVLLTVVVPAVAHPVLDHINHRLDCALRSSLILGVFGLGGLGTDLMLSLQSLRFQEVWTGLWLMAITMVLMDRVLRLFRHRWWMTPIPLVLALMTAGLGSSLTLELPWPNPQLWPFWNAQINGVQALAAVAEVNWPVVIASTLSITLMATCVSTALPPMLLLLWPSAWSLPFQSLIWGALRLIPPPLSALLLLVVAKPSLSLAALALGLHHGGVMGRVFIDDLQRERHHTTGMLKACGASARMSWLYGPLAKVSRPYLAYATYRMDVILRDTAVVGLVGGAGLGWQLLEALSSFHWWLVLWLVGGSALLTLLGENLSERLQSCWNSRAMAL